MNAVETKKQVMDLLNQILILTKDVPKPQEFEDSDHFTHFVTTDLISDYDLSDEDFEDQDIDRSKVNDDEVYLYAVSKYVKRVVDGNVSSATYNEKQYYNSTCY